MEKYRKLVKNSASFALGNLGSRLIIFIMLPLYTAKLSTAEYGAVDVIQTTVSLLLPIVTLSIYDAVLRFSLNQELEKKAIFSTATLLTILASLVVIGISFVSFFFNQEYSLYLCLILCLQCWQQLFAQFVKGLGEIRVDAINGVLTTFATVLSNVVLLVIVPLGITGYLWSIIVGLFLSNCYLFLRCHLNNYFSLQSAKDWQLLKQMTAYAMPLIPNSMAWFATNSINRYFILWLLSSSANGIFSVANRIPTLLSTVNTIFFQSWQLSAIEGVEQKEGTEYYTAVFDSYFRLLFLCASACLVVLKFVMRYLVAADFYSAWQFVPILLLSAIYSGFSGFFGQYYIALKETKAIFSTTVVGAIINSLLNLLLIPFWGLQGAGLGSAVSFLVIWLIRWRRTNQTVATKINLKDLGFNHLVFFLQIAALFLVSDVLGMIVNSILFVILLFGNRRLILLSLQGIKHIVKIKS